MGTMVDRVNWLEAQNPRELVQQACDRLKSGELVVFPTETGYVTAALATHAEAISRLEQAFAGVPRSFLALAPPRLADVPRLVHSLGLAGRRLAERCWPGPLAILFPSQQQGPAWSELRESARRLVMHQECLALWMPHHASLLEAFRLLPAPLVLGTMLANGQSNANLFGPSLDAVTMVIDSGTPRFAQTHTIIRLMGDRFEIVESGVISGGRLQRLANEMIAFVCSGNTCRSPMAEAIAKKQLSDSLGCDPEQLPERGFTVVSAGVAANVGAPASEYARAAVKHYGGDLDDHVAQRLTPELAFAADRIFVMTREHLDVITRLWPGVAARTRQLCPDRDVVDPFGSSPERYEACAAQIAECVRAAVGEILAAGGPPSSRSA